MISLLRSILFALYKVKRIVWYALSFVAGYTTAGVIGYTPLEIPEAFIGWFMTIL